MTIDPTDPISVLSQLVPAKELAASPDPAERAALLDAIRSGRAKIVFPGELTTDDNGDPAISEPRTFDLNAPILVIRDN